MNQAPRTFDMNQAPRTWKDTFFGSWTRTGMTVLGLLAMVATTFFIMNPAATLLAGEYGSASLLSLQEGAKGLLPWSSANPIYALAAGGAAFVAGMIAFVTRVHWQSTTTTSTTSSERFRLIRSHSDDSFTDLDNFATSRRTQLPVKGPRITASRAENRIERSSDHVDNLVTRRTQSRVAPPRQLSTHDEIHQASRIAATAIIREEREETVRLALELAKASEKPTPSSSTRPNDEIRQASRIAATAIIREEREETVRLALEQAKASEKPTPSSSTRPNPSPTPISILDAAKETFGKLADQNRDTPSTELKSAISALKAAIADKVDSTERSKKKRKTATKNLKKVHGALDRIINSTDGSFNQL